MTSFEYLAVLFSMLVGLAIARTFGGPGADGLPFWGTHMTIWLIGSLVAQKVKNERFLGAFGSAFLFFTLMASFMSGNLQRDR